VVSYQKAARDTVEIGLARMVGILSVVLPSIALAQVLANSGQYRQPAVAIAAWLTVLASAAWLVPRMRTGSLAAGETAAAIVIATVAVAAVGVAHGSHGGQVTVSPSGPGTVDLGILGTVWLLIIVVLSRPARAWVPGALLVLVVHGAFLLRDQGLNATSLSQLMASGYIMAAVLIAFAAVRPALATQASMAARRASLASRSTAERAAAAAIQQERRGRLAVLEREALPLLRAIANGTLDPATDEVQQQCAQHAAVLRHSLSSREPEAGALPAMLEPALVAARERGLLVTVQLIGEPGAPEPQVADAALAAVGAALSALPPHQVILTMLASGDGVELYLTFGEPLREVPDVARCGQGLPAAAHWHAAVVRTETGTGYLEVSWRKDGVP
jgi:hypothetical protein